MKNATYFILIFLSFQFYACQTPKEITTQQEINQAKIHQFLDQWHHAAAVADADTFYGAFTKDGIYIGTDPTEHWTAKELQTLFKKAFERESAWVFTPHDRHIYQSKNLQTIWFDELLDTWMGPCRGSGVLQKENGQWKIAHYHLSVAVANEDINSYLDMLKAKE